MRRRRWQKHYLGGTYYLRCATPRKKSKRLLRRADSSRYEPSIAGSAAVAILRNRRLFPYEMATNVVGARFLKYLGFKRMTLVPYVIDLSADSPVHQPMLENLQMADNLLRPFIAKTQICSLEEFDRLTEAQFREWNERDFCAHWFVCSLVACRANE